MADSDSAAPVMEFENRLRKALKEGLDLAGIEDITVETEAVPNTRLHRVLVIAKGFSDLRFSERQDLIWRIMDREFGPDEQLRISMILAMTPGEQEGE